MQVLAANSEAWDLPTLLACCLVCRYSGHVAAFAYKQIDPSRV